MSLWGDGNVLKLDSDDGCTLYEHTKNNQIVRFKLINFIVCVL